MFFEVSSNLISNSNHLQLSVILNHAINGLLNVKLGKADETAVVDWLQSLHREERDKWREIYTHAIKMESRYKSRNRIIVNKPNSPPSESSWDQSPPEITLSDAVDLAGQPKRVVLENSRADRKFILSLLDDEIRSRVLILERTGRIVFHNAGGIGELKKQLEEMHFPLPGCRYFCLVMVDSDSARPGEISNEANEVINLCGDHNVFVHCLKRRAIENYLPKTVILDAIENDLISADITAQVEDFFRLNDDQRHYFHLKNGMENKSCKESGLYENDQVKSFRKGFGTNFSKVFEIEDANLPKVYRGMLRDGATEEIQPFFTQLKMMIRGLQ